MTRDLRERFGFLHAPRHFASIRWRLTAWYVAILGLVLTIFGVILFGAEARSIRADLVGQLRREAQQLASTYDPSDGRLHPLGLTQPALLTPPFGKGAGAVGKPQISPDDIVVLLAGGEAVQQFGPVDARDIDTLAVGAKKLFTAGDGEAVIDYTPGGKSLSGFSNSAYLFYVAMFPERAGALLIVGLPDRTADDLSRLLLALLIAAPATLVTAAVGGYWLASRALRPVQAITHTARMIGDSDLQQRLNLPNRDELGELAATFDQMLDRLEASIIRQRQFTTDASHELRTPLAVAQLEVGRIQASGQLPERWAASLDAVNIELGYMARLVDNLLALARADAGQVTLNVECFDLADVAVEVVERLAPLGRERGLQISIGDMPELLVNGDRLYISRMLINLVENAIKYGADVGRCVRVEAECSTDEGGKLCAYLRVADNGPGIPADHMPRIFDRFYRVDAARTREQSQDAQAAFEVPDGSGLGLSIVRWVATVHGGDVRAESEVGHGSTFEIRLPLVVLGGPKAASSQAESCPK